MASRRSRRSGRIKKKNRTPRKRKGDVCDYVPCGAALNRCRPSYCYPQSSRNWTTCNMSNWSKDSKNFSRAARRRYAALRRTCRREKREHVERIRRRGRRPRYSVDAITLHNKMPYIWRFMRPETRKEMIRLAKLPVSKINIPGHIYPG